MTTGSMIRHLAGLAAFATLIGTSSPFAVAEGAATTTVRACEIWRDKEPTTSQKIVETLKNFWSGLFELEGVADTATGPNLYVTNTSDYSSQPKCNKDVNTPPGRREHLYYPIGLVVRKIGETDLRGKFWLVETEYGLKTFIKEAHLTSLRKDRVYFFANTVNTKKYYCPGQQEEQCTSPPATVT